MHGQVARQLPASHSLLSTDSQSSADSQPNRWLAVFEVVWIFLLFFLVAGSPPPDVGESHYLPKARHYWQPSWCAGDLFLESHDAHWTFYWAYGWVTTLVSLPAAAWIGRVVTWLLLAWSWQRLSWAIVPRPLFSLLSAAWFLLLTRNFHLAGEWVVGGVEAKGFAYVLVFLALEAVARNRWRAALLLTGAAGAFHVLVGGWTAVALGFAWLMAGKERPRLLTIAPAAVGGLVLALPGLIPAIELNRGVPPDVAREAERIYVFERLSHHLVYHAFAAWNVARFQFLVVAWLAAFWLLRKQRELSRVEWVVAGAAIIAAIGMAIDQSLVLLANLRHESAAELQLRAAPLLRYYWFRMSDSLVPAGLALGVAAGLAELLRRGFAGARLFGVVAAALAALNVADVCYWRSQLRVPAAVLQPRPTTDSDRRSWLSPGLEQPLSGGISARAWYLDWTAACAWIGENTPAAAIFITPREQQTFKWYAGRAEVANWKDVPQDAAGLVEWKRRLSELYPRDPAHRLNDLAAFSDQALAVLARKYGAEFIVLDATRANRPLDLRRVYPSGGEINASFQVFHVPPAAKP